jgi:16S rRNA (cytidine1402-2'-O)-methyltransferase
MTLDAVSGQLVVVATPIGNLGDLSPRALAYLTSADAVYCEDTRHSRTLFSANGVSPKGRVLALHEHNEASQCAEVVDRVARGEQVVLISDAGTPGISDPGARVIAAVADAGLTVTTAPGPSAVIAALSVSGLDTERFCMEGFVPRKAGERQAWYQRWLREERTIVFYESPQRVAATMTELSEIIGTRRVAVARELTKLHEEVLRGTVAEVATRLSAGPVLGEIVVVVEGAAPAPALTEETVRAALRDQLAQGLSVRDAVAGVVAALGVVHRDTYELALTLRNEPRT